MMNFIAGFIISFVIAFISLVVYSCSNSKDKAQYEAWDKYFLTDSLWYRTGSDRQIEFNHKGHNVSVYVEHATFEGTNRKAYTRRVYINNTYCATIIKIDDGHHSYYASYVIEPYIAEEVWGIISAAYNYMNFKEEEERKETKSLLT